jgi:hypothetical protein
VPAIKIALRKPLLPANHHLKANAGAQLLGEAKQQPPKVAKPRIALA